MKTNNDNRNNWEWCKEFGANYIGANAYDYAVIVRKNGDRLMCSDAETWAENTKGLHLASVAYVVMWCAYEYTDEQRAEAKANGERLTRGVASVVDFTANKSGYAEYMDEVTANSSNTECEYYNGTTGTIEKANGIADTVAQDYAQKTEESEQYKQFAEAKKLNTDAVLRANRKSCRLMLKYTATLNTEARAAWLEAVEERKRLEEIASRYDEQWHEIHGAWDARHMPAINAFLEHMKARKAKQTTEPTAEAVEPATEPQNDEQTTEPTAEAVETATEPANEPETGAGVQVIANLETDADEHEAYNPDEFGGRWPEMKGARYCVCTFAGGARLLVFHAYITPCDIYGQRVGTVEAVDVLGIDIRTDAHGLPHYRGDLLFTDYASADRAAND